MSLPPLILRKNEDRRLRAGHLWVFSNEVDIARTPLKAFQPGDLVEIQTASGHAIGTGYVNPNSLIAARILSRDQQHLPDRSTVGEDESGSSSLLALRREQLAVNFEAILAFEHYLLWRD